MTVLLHVRNLMFGEKILSAARSAGYLAGAFDGARPPEAPPDLIIVDLGEPDWEAVVAWATGQEPRPRILGFGPHVRADLFQAAREAGVDRAVANSRMSDDPAGLMAEVARA